MEGCIHSTESMGTVDGPGIRFVVFVQGCPLRCQYCHNPDSWKIGTGQMMSTDEIINKYNRNRAFMKNGGITVSGGEPLLQMDFVTELFQKARAQGIHTCLDTSGGTFLPDDLEGRKKMDALMAVTNLVMLDIKHIDSQEHKKLTGMGNENIIAFAHYLEEKKVPVWIRHVVVPSVTFQKEYLVKLGELLGTLSNVEAIDILPYHTMGKEKYEKLNIAYPLGDTPALNKEETLEARKWVLEGVSHTRKKI